jgi:ParB-like chromosome segregation protein Spo0J
MNIEVIPIASLQNDPANVRLHSERNIGVIKASLARFGQQKPIVIDDNNVVRAGNGTLEAARQLGWETIQVVRSELNSVELAAYAITDNRSGDPEIGSTWDSAALAQTLTALRGDASIDELVTGFTAEEINALIGNGAGPIPEGAEGQEFDESAADDVAVVTCPHCGGVIPK